MGKKGSWFRSVKKAIGSESKEQTDQSLLDKQQVEKIAENAQLDNMDSEGKVVETNKLKKLLSDFVEERKGWLEEIDRRQAGLLAAQLALEKLHQRDRSLTAENEIPKEENNILKTQNEDLFAKLHAAETFLMRLKKDLVRRRSCNARNPNIDFDEEKRLSNKLKDTEEERNVKTFKDVKGCDD